MLMLFLNNYFVEKKYGKINLVWPVCPSNFEIVFILLTKIVEP